MKQFPQKIAIIGLPGSGKSTFASQLSKILHIPVHHLDRHVFDPNGKKKEEQEFLKTQQALLAEASWIIEGCSTSTFEMRFAKAEAVIYLHFSRPLCFFRLCKRLFFYKKEFGGLRSITYGILHYTWNFDKTKRKNIEALKKKYPQIQFYLFKNQKNVNQFLQQAKGNSHAFTEE